MTQHDSGRGQSLTLATLALLLALAAATAWLVSQGFQRAQRGATQRSADELLAQTQANLTELTSLEAQLYDARLGQAAEITQIAARYVLSSTGGNLEFQPALANRMTVTRTAQLTLSDDKTLLFDANPQRRSEVLHLAWHTPDAVTERSLRLSAPLEDALPGLLASSPDAVTLYYQGPQLTFRSYPVRGLAQLMLAGGLAQQARVEAAEQSPAFGPRLARNPEHRTVWVPPYLDDGGNGLIVTVETPIYMRDEYVGFIGLDLSLDSLIKRLDHFKPISSSVAFLLDAQGKLVAMPVSETQALFGNAITVTSSLADVFGQDVAARNPALAPVAAAMRAGQTGAQLYTDNAQQLLVIYAPMPNLQWSLGLLVPLDEINGRARTVTSAIQQDADSTIRSTLLTLAVFFVVALGGVALLNQRQFRQAQQIAVLEERQRLSRELHDSVSQALYAIALNARSARAFLKTTPERVPETLDQVLALAKAGLTEMRALIFELRPESLEQDGLMAALTRQAEAVQARYEIEVQVTACDEPRLSTAQKESLYRIAQEALNNAIKHARATKIELTMGLDDRQFVLEVRDNGAGFDPGGRFPGHLGLRSMQERAMRAGGTLLIESAIGAGTRIHVQMPL